MHTQVFILEFISTLILGLVTFATVVDRERNMADNAAPLAVGLAYTVGMFAEGPYTGGSMNPARTLGPAIAFGDLSHVWWVPINVHKTCVCTLPTCLLA